MYSRWILGLMFAGAAVGCGEPPGLPEAPCSTDGDCEQDQVCREGRCEDADPRVPIGGDGVLQRSDVGPADAGPDGGGLDAGSVEPEDAGAPDAGPSDMGEVDGGFDAGVPEDVGGPTDTGVPGATVARGLYTFRRVLPAGLPSGTGLWRAALSPDARWLVLGTFDAELFVLDRATEVLSRRVELGTSLVLGDMAFTPGGDLLVAAYSRVNGSVIGELFGLDPNGGKVAPLGESRGMALQRIVVDAGGDADILGYDARSGGRYLLGLHRFDASTQTLSLEKTELVLAGCEGLARASDGLGGVARVYTCGIGGGDIGHFDARLQRYQGPGAGNVSHVDAHPSGTYALAVGWGGQKLLRFSNGSWVSGAAAPELGTPQLQKPEFSDDGSRAIILGGYDRFGQVLELREYRDGAYSTSGLTDISIAAFDRAPYLGVNGSGVFDATWRPGCDEGYMVGGCGELACGRGWLIHFQVSNGRACAP